jgi:hypothetical protein
MPSPLESDTAVVLVPDDYQGSMDDWVASLREDGPARDLPISGAELVEAARREVECP